VVQSGGVVILKMLYTGRWGVKGGVWVEQTDETRAERR